MNPNPVIAFADERRGAQRYLASLRQHALLIVLLVLGAVAVAAVYSKTATKRYKAEADILVSPVAPDDTTFLGFSVLRDSTDPDARAVVVAARYADSSSVAAAAAPRLHMTPDGVLAAVTVTPLSQGNIVSIVGQASNARTAATIANTFASTFLAQRAALFQQQLATTLSRLRGSLDEIPAALRTTSPEALTIEERLGTLTGLRKTSDPTLQLMNAATPPTAPVWPRPVLSVGVAFIAALLLGAGLAIGMDFVTPRIKQEDEILLEHRLPVLARVPRLPRSILNGYVAGREPLPGDARESYRTLRASLSTAGRDGGFPHTVLVTSAMPGEGKTMTAVNLAITLALSGTSVVLVDGDLRRPMVSSFFGVGARPSGFANVLAGRAKPTDAIIPAPGHGDRLQLLLASPEHAHLIDSMRSERIAEVLDELRFQADVVIIDSPPVTEVADALALADEVDAVIVCVRLGRSRRDRLFELRRMFAQHGLAPMGVVVTTRRRTRGHGYYYGFDRSNDPRTAQERRIPEAAASADDRRAVARFFGGRRREQDSAEAAAPAVAEARPGASDKPASRRAAARPGGDALRREPRRPA
ncbi:MAG TPA: P-loop NTPase [Gaiellaceae bacterium]|nr:P-loop NTPase [Gaiellaceae bacterium]